MQTTQSTKWDPQSTKMAQQRVTGPLMRTCISLTLSTITMARTGRKSRKVCPDALMSSVSTDGRRYWTRSWLKGPGLMRKTIKYWSLFLIRVRKSGRRSRLILRVALESSAVSAGTTIWTLWLRKINRGRKKNSGFFTCSTVWSRSSGLILPTSSMGVLTMQSRTTGTRVWESASANLKKNSSLKCAKLAKNVILNSWVSARQKICQKSRRKCLLKWLKSTRKILRSSSRARTTITTRKRWKPTLRRMTTSTGSSLRWSANRKSGSLISCVIAPLTRSTFLKLTGGSTWQQHQPVTQLTCQFPNTNTTITHSLPRSKWTKSSHSVWIQATHPCADKTNQKWRTKWTKTKKTNRKIRVLNLSRMTSREPLNQ